jgi:hypothetical protein
MNRETFPASLSPIQGDVSAPAGARLATVVGIRGTPISPSVPTDQNVLRFSATDNQWEPSFDSCTSILVNGVPTSDDYDVYVNAGPLIKVNGV